MRTLKIFSFFSGSGFLDLGFEQAGFEVEIANEFRPSFMHAYKYARERMGIAPPKYGYYETDVNEFLTVRRDELKRQVAEARSDGSLVGFIGGPPCPDFSIAGKQRGKDGENGVLSLSYVRLIVEIKPDFFLFENVKGLWRTARHRAFFEELKDMLHKAGYATTERLTNSLEFSAPQDRDRILLVGTTLKPNLDDFPWTSYRTRTMDEVRAIPWPETDPFEENGERPKPDGVPTEMTVQGWFERNDVENHPNAGDHFRPKAGLSKMLAIDEGDDGKKSYKRLHRWRYSPTVAYGNNEVHLHPYKARRLSVAEALALQTLPKEFALPPEMSLTDKFKTTGNGVPFVLAYAVARTIKDYFEVL